MAHTAQAQSLQEERRLTIALSSLSPFLYCPILHQSSTKQIHQHHYNRFTVNKLQNLFVIEHLFRLKPVISGG